MMPRTIIVSNRLPVKICRSDSGFDVHPAAGGLATGLGAIYNQDGNVWMGWPGILTEDPEEQEQIRQALAPLRLIPIFVEEHLFKGFYEGFSNEVLWPICHYRPSYAVYAEDNWNHYQAVNLLFAEALQQQLRPQDEVWVHDYQLMLLPALLRQQAPDLAIAYFHHIPFPSHELFRLIPWRDDLLVGLLGADLIGFHTYDDSRYFMDACVHLLDLKTHHNTVKKNGQTSFVEAYPMGIDTEKFELMAQSAGVEQRIAAISKTYRQAQLILSVDRLDYSKGIVERIHAYKQFLIAYPEFRHRVVYYMLVVPSRDQVQQYKLLKDEIDRLVGSVNAAFGTAEWTPIAYFYNSYPAEELSALYAAAAVCLVTPLRDGMNLVCKEFIASKRHRSGVLILSELAGAAKELIDAVQVNPCEINGVARALAYSLKMPVAEQEERLAASLAHVSKYNIQHWVGQFMARLREIKAVQAADLSRKIGPTILQRMQQRYAAAQQRIFFLDYDGTLAPFFKHVDQAKPTEEILDLLQQLQADPKNKVVLISGRKQQTLAQWFDGLGLILVAEHGAWTNFPHQAWNAIAGLSDLWKDDAKETMLRYVDRTPGAMIEEKSYSLAFHFRKVQKGLGRLRAHELMDQLRSLASSYGLQLLDGDDVIELKSAEVNKGRAASAILAYFEADFIFAIGDDATDEDMFAMLPEEAVSVKVGFKDTKAHYYVEEQADVLSLINAVIRSTDPL